jgi:hypothetical protein
MVVEALAYSLAPRIRVARIKLSFGTLHAYYEVTYDQ